MDHTTACVEATERRQFSIDVWKKLWDNHCSLCLGRGGTDMPGGRDSLSDYDPCACTERGICPRCGEPGLTSEERGDASTGEGPCRECGWNYDDACPEPLDGPCPCELAEMGRAEAEYHGGEA